MSFRSKTASIFHWIMYHCHQSNHPKNGPPIKPSIFTKNFCFPLDGPKFPTSFFITQMFPFLPFPKKNRTSILTNHRLHLSTPSTPSHLCPKVPALFGRCSHAPSWLRSPSAHAPDSTVQCEWIEGGKTVTDFPTVMVMLNVWMNGGKCNF